MKWVSAPDRDGGTAYFSEPYAIVPDTVNFGVVTYRLTGGGVDELSKNVTRLKEIAEDNERRLFAEAQTRRKREAEDAAAVQRASDEARSKLDELSPHVDLDEPVLVPDWDGLARAEERDEARRRAEAEVTARKEQRVSEDAELAAARRRTAIMRQHPRPEYPVVRCPGCKTDLNADSRNFVEDTDAVRYRCRDCGTTSAWDFDRPVPVRVA